MVGLCINKKKNKILNSFEKEYQQGQLMKVVAQWTYKYVYIIIYIGVCMYVTSA